MSRKRIDPKLPIPDLQNGSPAEKELYAPNAFGDRLLRRENELFREFDDTLSVYDEGTYLGEADGLNFVGTDVTASANTSLPGVYDVTVTGGSGGGGDTITATASEDIAAGQFVAVYDASGTPKCRVAKSSSGQGYQADGFCKDAFASGATATIFLPGAVNVAGGTGLTAGDVWLGTDGYATDTAPTTAGYISQQIGVAENSTHVAFEPQPDILIATVGSALTGGTSQSIEIITTTNITINSFLGAAQLTMVGGGAGGSASTANSVVGGKGGGAGELCENMWIPLTPGETITVTIGAGGASATDGGDTTIATLAGTYIVKGGKSAGGGGGPNGAAAGTNGTPGQPGQLGTPESPCHFGGASGGGAGSSASTNNGGAGGGAPGFLSGGAGGTGSSSGGGGGGGAATRWGQGGAGGNANATGSDAGSGAYGAGGGGGGGNNGSAQAGGSGQHGYALLSFTL